jgi:hypothetical protein
LLILFKRFKAVILLVIILLFNVLDLCAEDVTPLPFVLRQIEQRAMVEMVHVSDLNNDQTDEFILKVEQAGAVCAIRVYANNLKQLYYQKNFQKHVSKINTLNWDQKGYKEILFRRKRWTLDQPPSDVNKKCGRHFSFYATYISRQIRQRCSP